MDVFLSWSGERSLSVAEAFREWLPSVIQALNPYFTPRDIDKGQRWSNEIAEKLEKSQFGLIFVTKENVDAPWVLFEAGALSKNIGLSKVCPVLLDLKPTDISGPLVQFQTSSFEKTEIRKLLGSINDALAGESLNEKTLDKVFEKWWPELESSVNNALNKSSEDTNEELRSDRDIIEEILRISRHNRYKSFETRNKLLETMIEHPVSYDEDTRSIKVWFRPGAPYEIYLEQLTSGSELIDFAFQMNRKGVCKAEHIKAFLDCIEDLTDRYFQKNAQGIFCPSGINKEVQWPSK